MTCTCLRSNLPSRVPAADGGTRSFHEVLRLNVIHGGQADGVSLSRFSRPWSDETESWQKRRLRRSEQEKVEVLNRRVIVVVVFIVVINTFHVRAH